MSSPHIPAHELARIEHECRAAGVYEEYREIVEAGNNPRFAAMLALQSPAGSRNTDRAFCQGQRRKMDGMSPLVAGMLHKRAKDAGINTSGKYYMSGLGKHTDPAAWVSCAEDVLTVAKARNLNVEGVINHKAVNREPKPKPQVGLAPDIVRNLARKALTADPALAEKCKKNPRARLELREKIIDKHGRKKRTSSNRLLKSCRS